MPNLMEGIYRFVGKALHVLPQTRIKKRLGDLEAFSYVNRCVCVCVTFVQLQNILRFVGYFCFLDV